MSDFQPGENLSRPITWKPLAFLSHIKCRTNDDRFSVSQWESFGDYLQTCQTNSAASQVHDWVVYKLGTLFGSVGHRIKIHKITSVSCKSLKHRTTVSLLLTPCVIVDFKMTHVRFGRSHLHPTDQLTHTRLSDGVLDPDGSRR